MFRNLYRNWPLLLLAFAVSQMRAQQPAGPVISFPGIAQAQVFAGDPTETKSTSPASYTGPANGLVLSQPQSVVVDSIGNIYILDLNATIVRVLASGNGPIPTLPSVSSPQANTVYPLAGLGSSGCTTSTDSYGDGCLAAQATFGSGGGGLGLDANGNLYIADGADGTVRVVYASGSVPGLTSPTPGFIYSAASGVSPNGVAVDANGNIYIAEYNNDDILVVYAKGSVPSLPSNPTIGQVYRIYDNSNEAPQSVGLDASGNIYYGDGYNAEVDAIYVAGSLPGVPDPTINQPTVPYIIAGNGTGAPGFQNGIPANTTGIGNPLQFAFDAGENLYIPDQSDGFIFKVDTADILTTLFGGQAGCISSTDPFGDGCPGPQASLNNPSSVAATPTGLLIADSGHNLIRELNTSAGVLYFADIGLGTTSAAQSFMVANTGSTALTLSGIAVSNGFVQEPTGNNDCSSTQSLAPAASCQIGISFEPTQTTPATGTVTISSNAINATKGVNIVSLYGTVGSDTTTTLTPSASSIVYGQSVTLTAVVTSQTSPTPTGNVTFFNGSTVLGTSGLDPTGTATLTTAQLPGGSDSVTALYGGDSNHGISTSAAVTVSVSKAPATVSIVAVSSSNPRAGQPVGFQATVVSTAGTPTGSVTFMDGTTPLGTAALYSGFAPFTAQSLPVGMNSITAVYSGDIDFSGAVSAATQVTVVAVAGIPGSPVARISLSPRVAQTVAGDITGLLQPSPANYTGPVSGLVLNDPVGAAPDSYGNLYILDFGTQALWVVASGTGPIPSLPSVQNPQTNTVYPLGVVSKVGLSGFGYGPAIDNYGNVYVSSGSGLFAIYAGGSIPGLSNPTPGTAYSIGSGAGDVSVDSFGNVYQGGYGGGNVNVIYSGGQSPLFPPNSTPGSNFTISTGIYGGPDDVSVDAFGNVYVTGNQSGFFAAYAAGTLPGIVNPVAGQVYQFAQNNEPPNQGPQNGIPLDSAALGNVGHMATDTASNLYIPSDSSGAKGCGGNCYQGGYVYEADPQGNLDTVFGTPTPGCITAIDPLGDGCYGSQASLGGPWSVASDSSGDLYIVDNPSLNNGNNGPSLVRELSTQASLLSFGSQTVGTTSPVQTVTVTNPGAAPLTFSAITFPGQFVQAPSGGTDCSTSTQIAPGASCEIGVVYAPTQSGSPTGTATISSNANGANSTNTFALTGTTLFTSTLNLTYAPTNPGILTCCSVYQFVTLSAAISAAGGGAPTGTVTFSTANGTLGSATVANGVASISTNQLIYGTDNIQAAYSGDANHNANSASMSISIGEGVILTPNPSTVSIQPGQSQQITLTVAPQPANSYFIAVVALQCLPSSPGLTCSFNTPTLNFVQQENGAPQNVTVTLTAAPQAASLNRSKTSDHVRPLTAALLMPGFLGLMALCRRNRLKLGKTWQAMIFVIVLASGAFGLVSCSSGSGSSSSPPPQPTTQTVTINAITPSSGSENAISTTSFQVTVQ